MGRGAPVFCFGFAALVVGRLSADRDGGQFFFVLSVCGIGGEFFCADRDGGEILLFFRFAALAVSSFVLIEMRSS